MPGKRGLYSNIAAKRRRIKAGSGETMRKPGTKGRLIMPKGMGTYGSKRGRPPKKKKDKKKKK